VLLAGCQPIEGDTSSADSHQPGPSVDAVGDPPRTSGGEQPGGGSARRLLAALAVKGRAPKTGYAREQFGRAWADVDRNGCDTRDDILRRDLVGPTFRPGARACVVLSGTLTDPYTGAQIPFEHGVTGVDIDHVVALGDAWAKGASQWPPERRLALANDPLNLLAVDASANRSKGDGDAATWLPPSRAYRCKYVARQIAVKAKYQLSLTQAEHDAMAAILSACPDEPAPVGDAPTSAPIAHHEPRASAPASAPRPAEPPSPPSPTGRPAATDPNYGTCKQAKANRKGPYVRGRDPEYDYYQDRDADGVVCE
jgi:hypothetical protein